MESKKELIEQYQDMLSNEDFQRVFMKLHTPLQAIDKVNRNDICPFCDSGKKFKKCDCYNTRKVYYWNKYFKQDE